MSTAIPEFVSRSRVSDALQCANTEERVSQFGLAPAAIVVTDDGQRRPYYLRADVDAMIAKRNAAAIAEIDAQVAALLAQRAAMAGIG